MVNVCVGSDEVLMKLIVKVCGIIMVCDCESVCEYGVNFVGMIFWLKSKRSVDEVMVKEIVVCVKVKGVVLVVVFVDEDVSEIMCVCDVIGCDYV